MNIVLIGYRGSGKTTVARQLALRLGWDWVDADVEVELRAGKSIAAIFADEGPDAFRDWESAVLAELARRERIVLAAGGGAVLREKNHHALAAGGKLVWLRAGAATILRRIGGDSHNAGRRPNLTAVGGEAEIVALLAERAPIYQRCADVTIDTEGKAPGEVALEIMACFNLSSLAELA
ncbi:MAG TPA: shikimate kinase [Pirellulales bacterium]|nr:shikimate kinase [Pirellulales bacterium]